MAVTLRAGSAAAGSSFSAHRLAHAGHRIGAQRVRSPQAMRGEGCAARVMMPTSLPPRSTGPPESPKQALALIDAAAVGIDQHVVAGGHQMRFVQAAEAAAPALVGGAVAGDGEVVAGAFADRRRGDAGGQRRGQMQDGGVASDLDAAAVVEHGAARNADATP